MSDISKKIFSIDPGPDEDPLADAQAGPNDDGLVIPDPELHETEAEDIEAEDTDERPRLRTVVNVPDIIFRPIADVVSPAPLDPEDESESEPESTSQDAMREARPNPIIPPRIDPPVAPLASDIPVRTATLGVPPRLAWIGVLLGVFTAVAIAALVYVVIGDPTSLPPLELAALILAVTVPAATVIALWLALRSLARVQARSEALAEISVRLTRPDEAVTRDVSRMASAIRRELALVDSQLAQSRTELDTLVAQAQRQSADMEQVTQSMIERTEGTARAMRDHRESFIDLTATLDDRLDALNKATEAAKSDIGAAADGLNQTTLMIGETGETQDRQLQEAEARLTSLSSRLGDMAGELDQAYTERATHLSGLAERLGNEDGSFKRVLTEQSDRLGALDAKMSATEDRLSALLDTARTLQDQITARLSDIDRSLSDADQRAKAFTSDMADRVGDSISQTRRELSIMEGELRALQSRMDGVTTASLPFAEKDEDDHGRLHLTPLDTDFPPVEPEEIAIPDEPDEDDTLDLIQPLDGPVAASVQTLEPRPKPRPEPETDVIRRPGNIPPSAPVFGRAKKDGGDKGGWRWRDMLGTIDPIADAPQARPLPTQPEATPASIEGIERPPPGVPLQPPSAEPDGSDVVARLCEVGLAPSASVDDAMIETAATARRVGGEAAQCQATAGHLNAAALHLRGVLSADLEFRLKAESFRRHYDVYLNGVADDGRRRAALGSANGRAYILCAAAMTAS